MYIYDLKSWPKFTWNISEISDLLIEVAHQQGRLLGRMQSFGFLQQEARLNILTQDVIKTSEIEGEKFDAMQVRSSVAKKLGIELGKKVKVDRNIEGIVEVMLEATTRYDESLTKKKLCHWHTLLFPEGKSGLLNILVGKWRKDSDGPMQVVSGPYGKERVHFQAPDYKQIESEMRSFIEWFNSTSKEHLIIKSALAHFWFITIHPFEDGNGRIARAISDMLLARSEKTANRFYSMSAQIERERKAYYEILEQSQKGSLDITSWLIWFLNCMKKAIAASEDTLETVLFKAKFWERHAQTTLNNRQRLIVNKLLDGFEGNLTTSKWATIAKCSQDTALRDVDELLELKILVKNSRGGRSTSYQISRD